MLHTLEDINTQTKENKFKIQMSRKAVAEAVIPQNHNLKDVSWYVRHYTPNPQLIKQY